MPNGEEVLDRDENDQVEETAEETTQDEGSSESIETSDEQEAETKEQEKPKEEAKGEKPDRPVWTMPVSKAQEEKQRAVEKAKEEARQEAEAQMAKLKDEYETKLRQSNPTSYEAKLEKVARDHGLDPAAAKSLLDVFKESVSVPDMTKYDRLVKDQEIEVHKTKVSQDFDENVVPLILKDNPQATPEHIRSVKERVGEMAFSSDFNTYRLEDIYKVNKDEFVFKNQISAESSGGRGSDLSPFKKLSDEDEIKLAETDNETYKRYLKWLDTQGSRYIYT